MKKYLIGNIGSGFSHALSSTLFRESKFVTWVYEQELEHTFFIDNSLNQGLQSKCPNRYYWQVESRDLFPNLVSEIKNNSKQISGNFRYVFVHSTELVGLHENFVYLAPHATWIENPQQFPKSKLVSFLTSSKNWLPGHQKRLEWLSKLSESVDVYGRNINPVERVEKALSDYYFSICIENNEFYYSEKLLNNMACYTVPCYLGDRKTVSKIFNPKGIIFLDESFRIEDLTIERYESMLPYLKENFEIATRYRTVEDQLWEEYLKDIV